MTDLASADPEKPGIYTTEFMALVARYIASIVFVAIGAFSASEHSEILIIAGVSLLGVDAGFYTVARTYAKSRRLVYQHQYEQQNQKSDS